MSLNQVWSGSAIAPTPSLIVLSDTEHLMAVQTSFPKAAILAFREGSKVNYFAADRSKFDLQSFY